MKLTLFGDTYLDKPYNLNFDAGQYIVNLEYPISLRGTPAMDKVNLRQSRSYLKETFNHNPIAVNLANNHIMDYGEEAFYDTIQLLKANKIGFFGAGNKENNFNNPFILKTKQGNIAFLAYTSPDTHAIFGAKGENGSAKLEIVNVLNDINNVRPLCDFLVLNLHWGIEESAYPRPSDVKKARAFIDAGADLIVGHHAHVIQSVEQYKNRFIFYGIGNFIFPDLDTPAMFDGTKFNVRYKKKQLEKHRKSIVVHINKRFEIDYSHAFLDKQIVVLKQKHLKNKTRVLESETLFSSYLFFRKRKDMLSRWIKNPKIPDAKSLFRFFGF